MNYLKIYSQVIYFLLSSAGSDWTFRFKSKQKGYSASTKESIFLIVLLWSIVIETILKMFFGMFFILFWCTKYKETNKMFGNIKILHVFTSLHLMS